MREFKDLKIAVAGTGYVGLSIATLLSQHHKVTAVDRGIVCVVIPNVIYLIAYKKKMEFKDSLALVNKMTKGKLKGLFYKLGMTEG